MKNRILRLALFILGSVLTAHAGGTRFGNFGGEAAQPPLTAQGWIETTAAGKQLVLEVTISENTHIYADSLSLRLPQGITAGPRGGDKTLLHGDDPNPVFMGKARLLYPLRGNIPSPLRLSVSYRGCTGLMCFLPKTLEISVAEKSVSAPQKAAPSRPAASQPSARTDAGTEFARFQELAAQFKVVRTAVGYHNAADFSAWLKGENSSGIEAFLDELLSDYGLWLVALVLLPLGALLNLTPCVLPMVPITLGILGAAKNSGHQGRGMALGGLYGAGMALVYGALGLVVVLTGSRFGALNSSPWFNFAVAAVFIALALAMFDVWALDFTGFNKVKVDHRKSPFCGAFLLGGLTALLAGACVAPVLVWVLLLAADLYAKGNTVGLVLPFTLGLGMASPWPFLAAGVSRLPKPGAWMTRIKQAFGVLIILVAGYYAFLGYRLWNGKTPAATPTVTEAAGRTSPEWHSDISAAMREALSARRTLLLDFGGIACKVCDAMKATTLQKPQVKAALEPLVKCEFLADGTDDFTAGVVQYYHIVGLPTYILLEKK